MIVEYRIIKERTFNFNADKFVEVSIKEAKMKNQVTNKFVSIARGVYVNGQKIYRKSTLNLPDNRYLIEDMARYLQNLYKEPDPFAI